MSHWQVQEWWERGATLTVGVDAPPKQRHGRWERRELWALPDPELNGYAGSAGTAGEAWPHLQQVCRLERRRTVKGRVQVAVSYAVTSLPPTAAGADRLLQIIREHWDIENRVHENRVHENRVHENRVHENRVHENRVHENRVHENRVHENRVHENRVHWVGDVTFGEDLSQIRTGGAPQVMAGLGNLATTLVQWAGHTNVAAALRRHAAHLSEAFALLGISYAPGK